jgi:hypothetical protein
VMVDLTYTYEASEWSSGGVAPGQRQKRSRAAGGGDKLYMCGAGTTRRRRRHV